MLESEFALEKQGKSEANYLIAGLIVRLFLIAFGLCRILICSMAKKQYKFGISTTVDYSIEIDILFRLFSKYRFHFVSIGADLRHNFFPEKNKMRGLIKLAGRYDLQVDSIHIPFGNEYDLANPFDKARSDAVRNILLFLEYIADFGIPIAILHPHHYLKETKEKALTLAAESIEKIVSRKPDNVKIAVENLPDARGSWITDQLLNIFDQKKIGFCYDSSHENMSGAPFHLLKRYYSRLITCHLSDNNGSSDEHLVPGDGNIDWARMRSYINKTKSFGNILFEVGTGEKLSVPVEDYIKKTALSAAKIFNSNNNQSSK